MLVALLICVLATSLTVSTMDDVEEWETWKMRHGKMYERKYGDKAAAGYSEEERMRMKIWLDNRARIETHNKHFNTAGRGSHSYSLEMNQFGDLLHYEFVSAMNGFRGNRSAGARGVSAQPPVSSHSLPLHVDWRLRGAVTPVKDQGHCGSCWSFSATGALEAQHHRVTGELVSLSEQQLIDCSTENHGCNGGMMDPAFQYISDNGGIDTEESYPYEGSRGQAVKRCRYKPATRGATDIGFVDILSGDEEALKFAVATQGPVSVAIDAGHISFQFYRSGVYREPECSSEGLNHAVLVVGYGEDEEHGEFWLVKNSWSTLWGDEGYLKIARNDDNMCGVATAASYPLVRVGGETEGESAVSFEGEIRDKSASGLLNGIALFLGGGLFAFSVSLLIKYCRPLCVRKRSHSQYTEI